MSLALNKPKLNLRTIQSAASDIGLLATAITAAITALLLCAQLP
jgi:hypothetical protein